MKSLRCYLPMTDLELVVYVSGPRYLPSTGPSSKQNTCGVRWDVAFQRKADRMPSISGNFGRIELRSQ